MTAAIARKSRKLKSVLPASTTAAGIVLRRARPVPASSSAHEGPRQPGRRGEEEDDPEERGLEWRPVGRRQCERADHREGDERQRPSPRRRRRTTIATLRRSSSVASLTQTAQARRERPSRPGLRKIDAPVRPLEVALVVGREQHRRRARARRRRRAGRSRGRRRRGPPWARRAAATGGSNRVANAIRSRCFIPVEYSSTRRRAASASPTASRRRSSSPSSPARPAACRKNRRFSTAGQVPRRAARSRPAQPIERRRAEAGVGRSGLRLQPNAARSRPEEAGQDLQQGRLAAPVSVRRRPRGPSTPRSERSEKSGRPEKDFERFSAAIVVGTGGSDDTIGAYGGEGGPALETRVGLG